MTAKSQFERRVRDLAKRFGVKLDDQRTRGYAYDGYSIRTRNRSEGAGEQRRWSNVLHDIAHWLVADPARRKLPDFGLGNAPDSYTDSEPVVSEKQGDAEERQASLLGICYEAHLFSFMRALTTFDYHSWDIGSDDSRHDMTAAKRRILPREGV